MKKSLWIGGWAVCPAWMKNRLEEAFPSWHHEVAIPGPDWLRTLRDASPDWIGGYSLGAHLLLAASQDLPEHTPVSLAAPFFAFASEQNLGGRTSLTQVRFLLRGLRRQPVDAVADFHRRAGLSLPPSVFLPYSTEDLEWGLQRIAEGVLLPVLPAEWQAVAGEADPLLDAQRLHALAPALRVVPGTHDLPPLLRALSPP